MSHQQPQPKQPRVVKTWVELRREVRALRDFYRQASEVADDLVMAADMADEDLLAAVLTKHGKLKACDAFKVSAELWDERPLVLN